MPAPSPIRDSGRASRVLLARIPIDVVELAAFGGRAANAAAVAARLGFPLPAHGRMARTPYGIALSVRPNRWLLLTSPAAPGVSVVRWQNACAESAAATDLSSGLAARLLAGPAVREVLARGCRLDLDPSVFGTGQTVTTIVAQVSVTLCALSSGTLLLTPTSTARHLDEWLAATATPFGLDRITAQSFVELIGDSTV